MTVKTIHCDRCGKPALEVRYAFVREPDGAGGMETNYKTVDLCHGCAIEGLQLFLSDNGIGKPSIQDAFADWVTAKKWPQK